MRVLREYLRAAPWWAVGAVQGAMFAVFIGVFTYFQQDNGGLDAATGGLVGGLVFGLVTGLRTRRQRRDNPDPLVGLDAEHRRRVERAAARGPLPTDPADRRAAADLARHRLQLLGRAPRLQALVVFTVFLAADLVAAVVIGDWLYWVLAVAFVGLIVQGVRGPRRLQQRLALLTEHDGDEDSA